MLQKCESVEGKEKWRSHTCPMGRNEIKRRRPVVFTRFLLLLVKNRRSKLGETLPFCTQQSASMPSSTGPDCITKVSHKSRTKPFPLFIGEERSNMAAPWITPIRRQKSTSFVWILWQQQYETCRWKQSHFLRFRANVRLPFKRQWSLSLSAECQRSHKRFKRTLFIRTKKLSANLGLILFIKPQNDT